MCAALQADHELYQAQGPTAVKYGNPELWIRTSQRVGKIFGKESSGKWKQTGAPASDRRPPDTNEALARENAQLKQSRRPRKPLVQTLTGRSRIKLSHESDIGDSAALFQKEKTVSSKDSRRTGYQSYPHKANSCYITAPLEALYASYVRHRLFWSQCMRDLPEGSGPKLIFQSFLLRDKATGSPKDIRAALSEVNFYSTDFENILGFINGNYSGTRNHQAGSYQ